MRLFLEKIEEGGSSVWAWKEVERREAKMQPTLPARADVTGRMSGRASYWFTKLCRTTPEPLMLDCLVMGNLEIIIERKVAVQPSKRSSLT